MTSGPVIGTIATITSGAYQDAFTAAPDVEVFAAACPRFAEFVERGVTSGRQLLGLAESYLAPLAAADIDKVAALLAKARCPVISVENAGPEPFVYLSVTSPPINFDYAYRNKS